MMINVDLAVIRAHQLEHKQPCEHAECDAPGLPCYLSPVDETPDAWFCAAHAPAYGFCCGCGQFYAGDPLFDSSQFGLCGDCEDRALAESKPPLAEVMDDNDPYLWIDYDG